MTGDARTSAFYAHWAAHGEEADRSAISRHFEAAFAPGARVLDVGCGKGRDVVALLDMGFDAYGVEPNDAMRARAIERHPPWRAALPRPRCRISASPSAAASPPSSVARC